MANIVELREKNMQDLEEALENAREEMFNLRFQRATGALENYAQIGKTRRNIAQLLTVINNRKQAIATAAKDPAVASALAGKEWSGVASFDYERSVWQVELSDNNDNTIANVLVNLNKKRRGAREARQTKPAPQRVTKVEVVG